MPYRSATTDEVLLVEWGEATVEDVEELLAVLRKSKRKMICIAILRNSSVFPRAPARNRMMKTIPELLQRSASIHHVQADLGVRTAQLLAFATRLTTGVFLSSSVRQALEKAKPTEPIESILAKFRAAGFEV